MPVLHYLDLKWNQLMNMIGLLRCFLKTLKNSTKNFMSKVFHKCLIHTCAIKLFRILKLKIWRYFSLESQHGLRKRSSATSAVTTRTWWRHLGRVAPSDCHLFPKRKELSGRNFECDNDIIIPGDFFLEVQRKDPSTPGPIRTELSC